MLREVRLQRRRSVFACVVHSARYNLIGICVPVSESYACKSVPRWQERFDTDAVLLCSAVFAIDDAARVRQLRHCTAGLAYVKHTREPHIIESSMCALARLLLMELNCSRNKLIKK